MQPVGLQEWIHKIEEGEGTKYIRLVFFILAALALTVFWHVREAKNFTTIEAMDAAQVGRNLAEGKGFTTKFVRPFSIALIESHRGSGPAPALLKEAHPDIANAPLYPALLAGLFKIMPVNWEVPGERFWRYQPEYFIGGLNQLLFFGALFLVFRLSTRLFDKAVGVLAVVLMMLTELYWQFTTSGLSTLLLMVLFLWLVDVLVTFEAGARAGEGKRSAAWLLGRAAYAGGIVGLMGLTRYSMLWLIIPVAVFLAATGAGSRGKLAATAIAITALIMAPWLFRNYNLSGNPFGTAGFAIHHGTSPFPGHLLERAMPENLELQLNKIELGQYPRKLFVNAREIITKEIPLSAGNWIAALFVGAMLIPFRNPALARLKYFTVGTVLLFIVVEALGRTSLSAESALINSENLIFVFTPLFFLFGCGLFYILLDQVELPAPWLRAVIILGFVTVLSLPMMLRLLPPREMPVMYPPYWPPAIHEVSQWLEPEELMMSDLPWAVAWYGNRQSIWTTLDVGASERDDFYAINDERKAIKGLFLSPVTTNQRFLTEMWQGREGVWAKFYLQVMVAKNLPSGFPLKMAPPGLLPDHLFLSDRIRWRQ